MDYGKLVWHDLEGVAREWPLRLGANIIGRYGEDSLVLDAPEVSGIHAIINCQERGCNITDKSRNGTLLDGRALVRDLAQPLRHNTELTIGPFTLRFLRPVAAEPVAETVAPVAVPLPLGSTMGVINPREAARLPQRRAAPVLIPDYPPPVRATGTSVMQPLSHAPSEYLPYLPPIYHDSDVINTLLLACESILAPLEQMIGQMHAYFDPHTAPEALLPWLASWVDVLLDERLPAARQRALVAAAATLYRRRGTRNGLHLYLRLYTGVAPTIIEPGEEANTPGAEPLDGDSFTVVVPLDPAQADVSTLRSIIEAEKPAHTRYTLIVERPITAQHT